VAFALTGSITASLVRAVAVTGTITLDGTADSALLTHRPSFRVRVGSPGHGWEVGAPR
jgi:hypothetical protein